ncbi:DUF6680 family protein [Methylocystis sp. B8]|uniref:DUF6680 family protein n=1 Tax=Methylocystis sp. B8 TaxID=544938 RepID=UPI0010FDC90E|nr:DUF6680 family protein [Methylocystis sp. B8]TLG75163.1 hypothetical protein FEV16_11685 [Methylocystis sp. B8]
MIDIDPQALSAVAATASALAAALSVYATWRGPQAAATLAEMMRRDSEKSQERQRQKFIIFTTLMQERSAVYTENAVRALNLIDVVFHDSKPVREAWAELYLAFNSQQVAHGQGFDEKLRRLLATMANDIGLGDKFGATDLSRVYIPNALQQERIIRDMERQQALARLQANMPPSANTAPPVTNLFPPAPE